MSAMAPDAEIMLAALLASVEAISIDAARARIEDGSMEGLSIGPIGSFEDLRQLAIGMVRYWPFPCDLAGPPECAPNLDFLVACRAIGPLFAAERLDRGLTAEECRAVVENVLASFRARAREGT